MNIILGITKVTIITLLAVAVLEYGVNLFLRHTLIGKIIRGMSKALFKVSRLFLQLSFKLAQFSVKTVKVNSTRIKEIHKTTTTK